MTTAVDICNRALSSIGAQTTISSLGEQSPEAVQCALWYDSTRKQLLRTANWGFARRQVALTLLGELTDATTPFPYLFKYAYPADCLKFRYMIPPPIINNNSVAPQVGVGPVGPFGFGPSRQFRWMVNTDVDGNGVYTKTLLTNVQGAIGCYTMDMTNPDIFDNLFEDALEAAMAARLAIPVTGKVGLYDRAVQSAESAIRVARAQDGNEGIPTTDHSVDWITTREIGSFGGVGNAFANWGQWYGYNENISWGM
jgi:hypothetical protein